MLASGHSPLILGGDCSLLVGVGLALSERGRHGLVHIDGHTDFRHPGNSNSCASLGGEDLAAAVGLHWPAISDIDRRSPYFHPTDCVHIGCRDDDEELHDVRGLLAETITSSEVKQRGPVEVAAHIASLMGAKPIDGYWIHIDVDVLDPVYMPAVDSPAPGGLTPSELTDLLSHLAPQALGAAVTISDPDLDLDGQYALTLAEVITLGLGELGSSHALPPGATETPQGH